MATIKVKATEAGVKAGFDASDVYTADESFVDDDTTKALFRKEREAKASTESKAAPAAKKSKSHRRS